MKANAQFPEEESDSGEFQRQEDAFRAWVTDDGAPPHPVALGRYHVYVSHDDINPTRIVPIGPLLDLSRPHGREKRDR